MNNKKPNIFLVGAPKSGTTSIYNYLNEHPEIYMSPIKEPHYFSKDIRRKHFSKDYNQRNKLDLNQYFSNNKMPKIQIAFIEDFHQYTQLYRDLRGEKYYGEASTGYLFSKVAAKEIFDINPNAKIIMILRNPLERTYSHWRMDSRAGYSLSNDFYQDVIYDFSLQDNKWGGKSNTYIQLGLYSEQVKRYLDYFPKENIKIFFYEELENTPEVLKKDLYNFLEIKNINIDFKKRYNIDFKARNFIIQFLFTRYRKQNFFIKNLLPKKLKVLLKKIFFEPSVSRNHKIDKDIQEKIYQFFSDDIINLEKLLDINLSNWKL